MAPRHFIEKSILVVFVLLLGACGGGVGDIVNPAASSGSGGSVATTIPSPPTGVSKLLRDGAVTLHWNEKLNVSDNVTSYRIYLASDGNITKETYATLADGRMIEAASMPANVTGLTNGRTYYFIITAINNVGESLPSVVIPAQPRALPTAIIHTNLGDISLDLDVYRAPISVANFRTYADSGFYNGTLFHRVISAVIIQGGGFEPGMVEKITNAPIINESRNGLSNLTGTIAMARTDARDSATSGFFINVSDNLFFDYTDESSSGWGYAVFGTVTDGMAVVNQINDVSTGTVDIFDDVPIQDVTITSIETFDPVI